MAEKKVNFAGSWPLDTDRVSTPPPPPWFSLVRVCATPEAHGRPSAPSVPSSPSQPAALPRSPLPGLGDSGGHSWPLTRGSALDSCPPNQPSLSPLSKDLGPCPCWDGEEGGHRQILGMGREEQNVVKSQSPWTLSWLPLTWFLIVPPGPLKCLCALSGFSGGGRHFHLERWAVGRSAAVLGSLTPHRRHSRRENFARALDVGSGSG